MTLSSSFLKVYIFKLSEIFYLHLLFGNKGVLGIIVLPDASVYTHLRIYVYAPLVPAVLTSSLRLSVLPAGSWGAAEDERLPLSLCGTGGARDSDHIRRRPSSWGSFYQQRNSFILSSSLGWNRNDWQPWVAFLCILCVFGEEGRSCASSRLRALLFPCAALITID